MHQHMHALVNAHLCEVEVYKSPMTVPFLLRSHPLLSSAGAPTFSDNKSDIRTCTTRGVIAGMCCKGH